MGATVIIFLALTGLLTDSLATAPLEDSASGNRVLAIERCSTIVSGARATLIIGPLERTDGIYTGTYQMKVSPYFFKGEKGKLAISVSDESMAKVAKGMPVQISGTATTNGRNGKTRKCYATATPSGPNRGTLKLWFIADENKLVFETYYQLSSAEWSEP